DHPGRLGRLIREQRAIGREREGRWRKAEGKLVGEHQTVDRLWHVAIVPMQRRAEAQEARLIDGVARMEAIAPRQLQPGAHIGLGIEIDEAGAIRSYGI